MSKNIIIELIINEDYNTNKIPVKRGVRLGDTITPNLFTLALQDVFKNLNWDEKGIDGKYRNHLRFVDDIVLIGQDINELEVMLQEL